jgi:transposase
MKDAEWRNLIHKTAGKMIFIADSLGVLNVKIDNNITVDEMIKRIEEFLKVALDADVAVKPSKTSPKCLICGASGVFDCRTVAGFRYLCPKCKHFWNISEDEYKSLTLYDGVK